MELRSARTANDELDAPADAEDVEELAPPEREEAPPVAEEPAPDDPDEPEELLALEARVVPVADTFSPTCPDSDAIVPDSGAYSLVSWTACSSLWTVSASLLTAARADARLASRVAALTVVLEEEDALELEPLEEDPLVPVDFASRLGVELVPLFEDELGAAPALGVRVAEGLVAAGVVAVGVVATGAPGAGVVPDAAAALPVAGAKIDAVVFVVVGLLGVAVLGDVPAEPEPLEPSPPVSSALARLAWAD